VVYSSGSNVFGNNIANTQVLTGSVTVTGSLAVVTNGTELQVTNTGVRIGNISTDIHPITGSVNVSGSATFSGSVDGTIFNSTSNAFRLNGNNALSLVTLGGQNVVKINAAGFWGVQLVGANDQGIVINNTGQVGIGTTSPSDLFEVRGGFIRLSATAGNGPQFNLYSNGQTSNHVTLAQGFALATDNIGYLYNRANADFVFGTNNSEKMRITSGGGVEISQNNASQPLIYAKQTGSSGFTAIQFSGNNGSDVGAITTFNGSIFIGRWNGGNGSNGEIRINSSGGVVIPGSLSKGSGSFRIKHPLLSKKDTHQLVHSFIEGPQADLIYRGKIRLVNGVITVNIDEAAGMTEGTFEVLCREVQCFTSNETSWDAVRGKVIGNILTIESQNAESTDEISWMVVGERQDEHMMDTEWTDENGKVIVEPLI
jgi:hypothetical protein